MREWTVQDVTVPMPIPPTEGPWIAAYVAIGYVIIAGLYVRFPFGVMKDIFDPEDVRREPGCAAMMSLIAPLLAVASIAAILLGTLMSIVSWGAFPPPWKWERK